MSCVPVATLILIDPWFFASITFQCVFTCSILFPDSILKRIANNSLALIFIDIVSPFAFGVTCINSCLCYLGLSLDLYSKATIESSRAASTFILLSVNSTFPITALLCTSDISQAAHASPSDHLSA